MERIEAINKITGQTLSRISLPDYKDNPDWIILPTLEEIEQYKYKPTEEEIKAEQIAEIDQQIGYEMTRGYDFEGGTMSTSPAAQMNWGNVLNRYNAGMNIVIPFPVSLKNGGVYMINTVEEVIQLFKDASEEIEIRHNTLLLQRAEILNN